MHKNGVRTKCPHTVFYSEGILLQTAAILEHQ